MTAVPKMLLRRMSDPRCRTVDLLTVYRIERNRHGRLVYRLAERVVDPRTRPDLRDRSKYDSGAFCAHNQLATVYDLRHAAGLDSSADDTSVRNWWEEHMPGKEKLSDGVAFVRAIHGGNYDAAAVFADWLEERGDVRGPLLRKRWKRWQKERDAEVADAKRKEQEIVTPFTNAIDSLRRHGFTVEGSIAKAVVAPVDEAGMRFRRYVQKQFPLPEFWHIG